MAMETAVVENGPQLSRIILFVWNVERVGAFYQHFFDMRALPGATGEWLELVSPNGGCNIALHKTPSGKPKCNTIKLVFGIAGVAGFKRAKEKDGLKFGVVQKAEGFEFSNANVAARTMDP